MGGLQGISTSYIFLPLLIPRNVEEDRALSLGWSQDSGSEDSFVQEDKFSENTWQSRV